MATLKISDLSVGDWVGVRCGTKINAFKVEEIRFNNIIHKYVALLNNKSYGLPTTELHPIPITAEILEKNGWKLSKSNWFEFEDGEWKINIWIGKSKCNIEISQKREIYMSTYADIQVVKSNINTLQHALRLAGVDKEINL